MIELIKSMNYVTLTFSFVIILKSHLTFKRVILSNYNKIAIVIILKSHLTQKHHFK